MRRRTDLRRAFVLVPGVLVLLATAAPATADDGDPSLHARTLTSFADPEISESSGLVDLGRALVTTNDSGDGPRVFVVDPGTGRTLGQTTYSAGDATDVEALAPAGGGAVWVGDIGDNRGARSEVEVYRVPVLAGGTVRAQVQAPRYRLRYPDGPRDAETLLRDPRSGRLLVVSKSVFGGTVYRAPRRLDPDGVTTLEPFARVDGLVTDGTFLPDGRHVLLRTYTSATVYTYPGFEPVGTVRLPGQSQGEAISYGPGGRVLLSSEGVHSKVLQVDLPAGLLAPEARSPSASPSGPGQGPLAPVSPPPTPATHPYGIDPPSGAGDWARAVGAGLLVVAVGLGIARLLRRPG